MSMANRVSFQRYEFPDGDERFTHHQPDGGRITVVDRMTGFGWRDIETGYRCPSGQFWLASGNCDIRDHLGEFNSDDDMAAWVISRANNCMGGHDYGRSVGTPLAALIAHENKRAPR